LWGTNGLPWKESLKQLCNLGLKDEVERKLMRENAVELFKLNAATYPEVSGEVLSSDISEPASQTAPS
jgi:hypothetical protein